MSQFVNYTLIIRNDGTLVPQINGNESKHDRFNEEQLRHINAHLHLLKKNKLDSREMFVDFGNYLFEALLRPVEISFSGEVWRQHINKSEDTKLRIRIVFEDFNARELTSEIINLPWEFLCYPDDDNSFLGTHPRVALSCGYQTWLNNPLSGYTDRESPLRVLFVHGHPSKLPGVGFVNLVQRILTELDDKVKVSELKDPTQNQLNKALSEKPHILHFLGHGKPGALALGNLSNGEPYWLNDKSLSDFLRVGGVKLAVLQACEGASPSEKLAFTGTAAQLVKTHVPAVIAVRYPISQSLAWNFIRILYGKLAAGEPVDVAVQSGREQLAIGNDSHACRDFGAPVLWMRLRDGLLFPAVTEPPKQIKTSSSLVEGNSPENPEQSSSGLQNTIEVPVINNNEPDSEQKLLELENLLKEYQWRQADDKTTEIMLEIADKQREEDWEKQDIDKIRPDVICKIDRLWQEHSNQKFGFYIQLLEWNKCKKWKKNKEKFAERVGWYDKEKNQWLSWEDWKDKVFRNNVKVGLLPTPPPFKKDMSHSVDLMPQLVNKIKQCDCSHFA
ncbi:MAG: CHAT domain-containing protein [Okeania sp. SIO2F4]|uniref:GUN4 domain-containing protein n=1 Tax=Okeania sp. SIO2F4 TaxID=2607790 RepID=UPI00142C7274|nr:GUN4 domain-containing protein [Okeania sp. SIO2F4]NES03304.1 CHAT domain-containing protein [Okeania sp. SIO2F4]